MTESPLRCEIPWERYGLIAAIVRGLHPRSPQLGKTVLQKVVFLLQDLPGVPIGYRFQFYTYGPFSVELLQDLDLVEGLGGVKIHRVVSLTGGFEILPGDRADGLIRKAGNWLKEQGADDAITRIVAEEGGAPSDIVKITTFVTSIPDWRAHGEEQQALFTEYFQGEYPANTLVEITALAEDGLDVEIEAIAELG